MARTFRFIRSVRLRIPMEPRPRDGARVQKREHTVSASRILSERHAERVSAAGRPDRGGEEILMPDLLLTHGYFLYEDPKEMQIMKPYAPLGILYLCSHLRQQGFDVEVFDTTFSSRESLFRHLETEKPSVLGIYANLMTRGNVVQIIRVAREAGWRVIVGGPEPGAYAQEFLESGADFVVLGEGEATMQELLTAFRDGCGQSGDIWKAKIAGMAYL